MKMDGAGLGEKDSEEHLDESQSKASVFVAVHLSEQQWQLEGLLLQRARMQDP
jgi:hypothetical protein